MNNKIYLTYFHKVARFRIGYEKRWKWSNREEKEYPGEHTLAQRIQKGYAFIFIVRRRICNAIQQIKRFLAAHWFSTTFIHSRFL